MNELNDLTIDPKLINYNVEFGLIRFLHSNPDKLNFYKDKYFLTRETYLCFKTLIEASYKDISFEDFIKIVAGNNKGTVDEHTLKKAFDQSSIVTVDQEETYRKNLINNYTKYRLQKEAFEKVELLAKEKGWAKSEDLISVANKLRQIAREQDGEQGIKIYSSLDLYEEHRDIISKREQGLKQRTIGYVELDQMLTRPAAGGEITTFVALTGIGKSLLLKNLEYKLISSPYLTNKPCVLSLNMEMTNESIMDRYLSMYHNFDLKKLQDKDEIKRAKKDIIKALRRFSTYENYLYVSESSMDLDVVSNEIIPRAKAYFREKGLLPDDEYMVLSFDALTHLSDFDDAEATKYETVLKNQAIMAKEHNVHCINVVQGNENKFRYGTRFKHHAELDKFILGLEDIFGSSAIAKYSRAVFSINRPLVMKKRFFPMDEHEWMEEYGTDGTGDIMDITLLKQNDGDLGTKKFVVQPNMLITSLI